MREPVNVRVDSRRAAVTLITMLALSGALVWSQIPPWERAHIRAVCRARVRWFIALAARRSARMAMADELTRGRPEPVMWRYRMTERLSRLRDDLDG